MDAERGSTYLLPFAEGRLARELSVTGTACQRDASWPRAECPIREIPYNLSKAPWGLKACRSKMKVCQDVQGVRKEGCPRSKNVWLGSILVKMSGISPRL